VEGARDANAPRKDLRGVDMGVIPCKLPISRRKTGSRPRDVNECLRAEARMDTIERSKPAGPLSQGKLSLGGCFFLCMGPA